MYPWKTSRKVQGRIRICRTVPGLCRLVRRMMNRLAVVRVPVMKSVQSVFVPVMKPAQYVPVIVLEPELCVSVIVMNLAQYVFVPVMKFAHRSLALLLSAAALSELQKKVLPAVSGCLKIQTRCSAGCSQPCSGG